MIVAIDGPAASGKTTVARALARRLGFGVMPSGATYRALAWAALRDGVSPDDPEALAALADRIRIQVDGRPEAVRLAVDGVDVTEAIRSPEVGEAASALSRFPAVRERLVALQRSVAAALGHAVAEGRDMTTVVFPDAAVKVYLDATLPERARRRAAELAASGRRTAPPDAIQTDLERRDRRDSTRRASPLARHPDAHYLDTTALSVEAVVDRIAHLVDEARARSA